MWLVKVALGGPCCPLLATTVTASDAVVGSLINHDLHCWNHELINSIFLPFEAAQSVNIRFRRTHQLDKYVWHWTKDSVFTVKSSYYLLVLSEQIERQSGSFEFGPKRLRLWKLCIPPKNRHFLWRCNFLFLQQTTHPRNIVYASRAVLDDNRKENRPFQTAGSTTEHIRWIPPQHEVYKLNTDAGLVGSDGYGIGVVLWDSACRLN
ncbi:Ribonuclease H protein [Quillaja saponaria]|uniref:Ribonuclease H protein n=1 Tax=Quillaja saponaria TaxID=32244 RepID=A0AAD7L150_QUISA|nr:Ribonuclease H protein [Quillaja saponaria]